MLGAALPNPELDVRFTQSRLQLLDLVKLHPLARVRAGLAALDKPRLAALQELPFPGRDRLLARLPTTSGLGGRHLTRNDREDPK